MEARPESAEDKASLEATHWLVALQEEPDNRKLRRRFDEWRAASPLNEAAWSETQQLAGVATTMAPAFTEVWGPAVATKRRSFGASLTARSEGPPRHRWPLLMVAAAVAACLALLVVPSLLRQIGSDYTTATAELRRISLQDGSEVILAPASAIAVSYDVGERRVRLLSGEAFFRVTPDSARPFRVAARSVETAVLGTRFDVRMDSEGVTVSVEEGSVQVGSGDASRKAGEKLRAGEVVRMTWEGDTRRRGAGSDLVAAWRDGQLVAQDQSLREAIDQLRRYFSGTILLIDAALGERRVTGAYNLADPEDALRGLAEAHGAKVRRITPWILVISES